MTRSRTVLALLISAGLASYGLVREARRANAQEPPLVNDIWAWGRNRNGELGIVSLNETVPTRLGVVAEWVAVAAGSDHVLALDADGAVWAWGGNDHGQLGDGTTTRSLQPRPLAGLTGITQIEAGGAHSLALRASDDTLWVWGSNSSGQLGLSADTSRVLTPHVLDGLTDIVQIAAGNQHSLALTADGAVWSWGGNFYGQLGHGDETPLYAPMRIPSLAEVSAVGAGSSHSLAVAGPERQVWTWGWNVFGQLGTGTQGTPDDGVLQPAQAVGVVGIIEVTGGDFHSLARTETGRLWSWGYNTEGQVGNGAITPANTGVLTPVLLDAPRSLVAIDAGGIHSIALSADGEIWAWGSNQFGSCGNGRRRDELRPVRSLGVEGGVAVAAGSKSSIAIARPRIAARAELLGGGVTGATADAGGPLANRELQWPPELVGYSAGARHILALDGERRVWVWGDNDRGQLGRPGSSAAQPELLTLPLEGAAGIAQVAAGPTFSLALRSDGVVFAWGDNRFGQLGLGDTRSTAERPAQIPELRNIVQLAAGELHALALDNVGATWAWGDNRSGQLGRPSAPAPARSPAPVPALFGATSVAAGGFHSLAISPVGTVLSWGSSLRAQLGQNRIGADHRPRSVSLLDDVAMIAAGRWHSLALRSDGSVWGFGHDGDCQLGQSVPSDFWIPVEVPLGGAVAQIAAGEYHSLAVNRSGGLFVWGNDGFGQLGAPQAGTRQCRPVQIRDSRVHAAAGGREFTLFD